MARILVVDDNEVVRRIIRQALEFEGHDVEVAENGNRALDHFRERVADLVITDIVMPEKEGIETILELRLLDTDVKILAISGGGLFSPGAYLSSATLLGADGSLAKPFTARELIVVVDDLLGDQDHDSKNSATA